MRSRTPPDLAGRCHACFFPTAFCLCAAVVPQATRVEVVIVRHAMERWKTSNTARWALLALPNARLVEYGLPDRTSLPAPLGGGAGGGVSDGWLVFPGPRPERPSDSPPTRLVFIDGSWSQARRMVQRLEPLRSLPRFSLPPPGAGSTRLRRAPSAAQVSTMEAIGAALDALGEAKAAAQLLQLHALAVQRSRALRG